MALVNLTQAASMAGISRVTLNKHRKDGKVSTVTDTDGNEKIDTAEIMRVYGTLVKPLPVYTVKPNAVLQREIEALQLELKAMKDLLSAREAHILTLQELNKALQPVKQISWINRLFGGKK